MTEQMSLRNDFAVATTYYKGDDGLVMCGAADTILQKLPAESIQLCFTDPDYSKGSLLGYWTLSRHVPRVLSQGAPLIVEAPHKYLPAIIPIFQIYAIPQGMTWRWLYSLNYATGRQRRLRMGIRVMFKPLLCYVKGKWKNRGFVKDGFECKTTDGQKKKLHKWEKNLDAYCYYIERHTDPGDIVLDPYAGSFKTAFACRKTGRRFICVDIDHKLCERAAEALKEQEQ